MPTVSVKLIEVDDNGNETVEAYEVEADQRLYDALEAKGKKLPHGCLAGACGSCKIEIIDNPDGLSKASAIEKDTLAHLTKTITEKHGAEVIEGKTLRLSCRAKVVGDITFKPLKVKS